MADRSGIEWTETTWNPVTGCDRISPGCDNCYALRLALRLKAMGNPSYRADGDPPTSGPGFGVAVHPAVVGLPYRWRRPRLVFVNSMSDLFHARVPRQFVADVFGVMADTPRHTYQVLTKRPERALRLADALPWPPNVWLGVSAENQRYARQRIPRLLLTPAAVRFVSAEPLLGPIDLAQAVWPCKGGPGRLDWVIAGGESGPGARPMDPDWARGLREQCQAAGVAFFFKQWGGPTPKAGGRLLDGRTWDDVPDTVNRGERNT